MQKKWSSDEDKCTFIILDNQLLGSMANESAGQIDESADDRAESAGRTPANQTTQTNQTDQTEPVEVNQCNRSNQIFQTTQPVQMNRENQASQAMQTNQGDLANQTSPSTNKPPEHQSANEIRSMIGDTNLFLNNCDVPDEAEIEIMIAEQSARGKGLGREALRMMIKFAFERLQLNRLIAKIKQDNEVSIVLFKSLGFEEVSRSEFFQEYTFQLDAASPAVKRVLEIEVTYRSDTWE